MAMVRGSGRLQGEEHIIFLDKVRAGDGTVTRMYQFSMEVSGGPNGVRRLKSKMTTSLEQAKKDRDLCIQTMQQAGERMERSFATAALSNDSTPTSPTPAVKDKK
eukprot:CAMPEP_0204521048 /NCGR_PEP_ID=MMETSP0661-20131031/5580_1 /ASSEMBLY_ACC=CAM_ASM_000606 /TAXON_ID=109239 /ORGANISM="Alexandrium margalefi, Strain AMGDE01CS-322" /LENGTH=104 /DNA_ID=CAMNT_0051526627 /DNA_START=62 /DNA_END=376 /DNA_ORIENTATION=-